MKLEELPKGKPGQILKEFPDGWKWVDMTEEDEKFLERVHNYYSEDF